jgi:hypothetical protein
VGVAYMRNAGVGSRVVALKLIFVL